MSRAACTERDCKLPALITTGKCVDHTYLDEQARRPPKPANVIPISADKRTPMLPAHSRPEG